MPRGGGNHPAESKTTPLNARTLHPLRRCVGASLVTRRVQPLWRGASPQVFFRLAHRLWSPREFRRRTAAAAPARCPPRRACTLLWLSARRLRGAAPQKRDCTARCGVCNDAALLVSLQGARRARFSALSRGARRARRVCGGSRGGGEMRRVGCAAARRAGWRRARGEKKAVPRWTHARAAGAFFDCLPARETCAGACCAPGVCHGQSGVAGAPERLVSLSEKAPAERLARTPRRRRC